MNDIMTLARPPRDTDSIRRLMALVLEKGGNQERGGGRSFAKTEILLHSMSVFSQQSLDQITVQHLLDAAKVSRRTFYKYFENKIDVLENIFQLSLDVLIARFETELPETSTVPEMVDRMLGISFAYHVSVGKIIGLMQQQSLQADSPLAPHRRAANQRVVALLQRHFHQLTGKHLEKLLGLSLLWAMESASLYLMTETGHSRDDIEQCETNLRYSMRTILDAIPA